jgi:hypothetical protein
MTAVVPGLAARSDARGDCFLGRTCRRTDHDRWRLVWASQQPRTCVITKRVRIAHVAAQRVDRLVPADIHHLEQRGAAGGSRHVRVRRMLWRTPAIVANIKTRLWEIGDVVDRSEIRPVNIHCSHGLAFLVIGSHRSFETRDLPIGLDLQLLTRHGISERVSPGAAPARARVSATRYLRYQTAASLHLSLGSLQ